ncbi:transglycosylase SLT domain-containing protein [Streptomyces sp. NPDC004752]
MGAVSVTAPADAAHSDLPALALDAYQRAADEQAIRTPGCHLPWTLLAAIGQVESHHARNGALTSEGFTTSPILGPVLNGGPFAALRDSDQGRFDGDTAWDRAVGPMQFIPSTWKRWGTTTRPTLDADPNNIFDATTTAAAYLCADHRDLNDPRQLNRAVLSYNPSETYLRDVLAWNSAYATGHSTTAAAVPAVDSTGSGPGVPVNGRPAPSASAGQVVTASLPRRTGPGVRVFGPAGGSKGAPQLQLQPSASASAQNAGAGAGAGVVPGAGAGAAKPSTAVGQAAAPQQLPPSGGGVPGQAVPPAGAPASGPRPDRTGHPSPETGPDAPHTPAPRSPSVLTRATAQLGGLLHHLGQRILG